MARRRGLSCNDVVASLDVLKVTFIPDQRTRKPNSSVMSTITLCAKSTENGCATNARSKS